MLQPPDLAALGQALLRAALAAALVLPALAPSTAEAQRGHRGRALRLDSLQVVELGRANGRRGDVTRWGLRYRRSARAHRPAQLQVDLERGPNRRLTRHVQLTGRHGTVAVGPARGIPRVTVRALDRWGRPMAIRVGNGPRRHALALSPEATRPNRPGRSFEPVTMRVHHHSTRTAVRVNGQTWVDDDRRTTRTVNGRVVDDRYRRGSPDQLAAADRACRDAFTGNENEMRCLQLMRFHPRAAAQVAACEDAFTGDDAELRCLEIGAAPRHVAACEDLLTGDDAELRCLETVSASRARPEMVDEVLRVCEERVGDDAELACVEDLLGGRRAKR